MENEPKQAENPKEKRLEEIRKEVEELTDDLGRPIDEGIKHAVIMVRANGFNTENSCEGHLERGSPVPFVDIEAPNEPEEKYAGQKEVFEKVAQKYDLSIFEVIHEYSEDPERKKRTTDANNEAWDHFKEEDILPEYRKWLEENEYLRTKLKTLVDEFYKSQSETNIRLKVRKDGRLWIESSFWDKFKKQGLTPEDREQLKELLPRYQKEMNDFAEFLKKKFLDSESSE